MLQELRHTKVAAQGVECARSELRRRPVDINCAPGEVNISTGRSAYKLPDGVVVGRVGDDQVERESAEYRVRACRTAITTTRAVEIELSEIYVGRCGGGCGSPGEDRPALRAGR